MSRMRRIPLAPAVLLLLAAGPLTACADDPPDRSVAVLTPEAGEGDDGAEEGKGAEQAGTPQTVDCPDQATAVDLPSDFAAPLPEDSVVVAVEDRDGGRTVVTAVVPHAEPDVLTDLQAAYPAAGLTLTEGETEARDAESNFTGDGVTGRWGIRELADCPAPATRIDLVVRAS
jgi:hypothetical protein